MFESAAFFPVVISGVCLLGIVVLVVTSRSPEVVERVDRVTGKTHKMKDKKEEDEGLTQRVIQAGLYRKRSIGVYYIARIIMILIPMGFAAFAIYYGLVTLTVGLVYGILAGALGTVAPSFWLDFKKRGRQTKIRRALPDALDVIIVCVEAGMSLPAAIARVSSELAPVHPLLSAEMSICKREVQMGCTTGEALKHFSQRFDLEELRSLASVVDQAERFGASIANALRVHAETLRLKRFQRAEELAQQAAVKLVFPTILCIFPALFIVLAGPAVFKIFEMFDKMAG